MALPPLWAVATALLDLVEATFAAEGVELPARRYVTAGSATGIAWDCEQVVIGMLSMSPLPAGSTAGAGYDAVTPAHPGIIQPPSAEFLVEVTRTQPEPPSVGRGPARPPTVAEEMCAAEKSLKDAAALHRCAVVALRQGLTPSGHVSYAGVEPAGPDSGMSAQRLRVAVTLL